MRHKRSRLLTCRAHCTQDLPAASCTQFMKGMTTGQGVVLVALDVNDNSAKMNAARWGRGCLQAACTARWALGGAASNARAYCSA